MKDSLFAFDEIAVNVGSHFYFIDEARNDYIWVPDKPYEEGSWGYVGGKMYLRDFEEQVGSSREIIGTDIDPIYQTQRYGLDEYRFDVPNGRYEVTLYFSELISGWFLDQYLEHTDKDIDAEDYQRVFSVEANGQPLLTKMNLAEHYGPNKAITKKWVVEVKDGEGLRLNFEGIKDVPVVNGIRLRKMHP
jgi:beta-galactosidase